MDGKPAVGDARKKEQMRALDDRVTVTPRAAAGAAVLELRGEIDLANAGRVAALLGEADAEGAPPVPAVLDLTGVRFLSAAGVRVLSGFAAARADRGLETRVVVQPGSTVERVLRLGGLARLVLFSELDEALRAGDR